MTFSSLELITAAQVDYKAERIFGIFLFLFAIEFDNEESLLYKQIRLSVRSIEIKLYVPHSKAGGLNC